MIRYHRGAIILAAALSCGTARASPNIIIFSLDSVPAAYTHLYGYEVENTPNLDAFAKDAVVLDNAISCAPWTVPSHRCLLTSLYPSQHGLTNFWKSWHDKIPLKISDRPDIISFEKVCEQAGYKTGAFTGDAGVSPSIQDFQIHYEEQRFGLLGNSQQHAQVWLNEVGDKPFCALFHGYNGHGQSKVSGAPDFSEEQAGIREAIMRWIDGTGGPVYLSDEQKKDWRHWYDEKIRSADADFGEFIAELKQRNLYDKSIIAVTSDHGTDVYDHGYRLDALLLHIVLMIKDADGWKEGNPRAGTRVKAQVSNIDVMPTILGLSGIIGLPFRQMQGLNLFWMSGLWGHDVFPETDFGNHVHLRGHWKADGTHTVVDLGKWGECLPIYPGQCPP